MSYQPAVLMTELVLSVDRLIQSASQSQPRPGEWAPQIVLGHIAMNDEQNWSSRLERMTRAHRDSDLAPVFDWFEPPAEEVEREYSDVSVEDAGARLLSTRTHLLTKLRDLSKDDWDATAEHAIFGLMTVYDLVLQILAHDEEHRAGLLHIP